MEDMKKFTDYQWESLGGEWIYTPYMDYYKRNKRDVKKYLKYNNKYYEIHKNIEGFYNKAIIYKEIGKDNYILLSYETIVAEYNNAKMIIYDYFSKTTANHINYFLSKFGYKPLNKKEILKIKNIEY